MSNNFILLSNHCGPYTNYKHSIMGSGTILTFHILFLFNLAWWQWAVCRPQWTAFCGCNFSCWPLCLHWLTATQPSIFTDFPASFMSLLYIWFCVLCLAVYVSHLSDSSLYLLSMIIKIIVDYEGKIWILLLFQIFIMKRNSITSTFCKHMHKNKYNKNTE